MGPEIFFIIAILVMSVVIHELAHGYSALFLGDPTAKLAGRLTMNPIKHMDPFGSVILPVILALLPGNFILGWAKPVPYNPYNLKNQRWGELFIAAAGPLSNFALAIIFGLFIRFAVSLNLDPALIQLSFYAVLINLALGLFNLIPVAPLDGSKILFSLLPPRMQYIRTIIERYSLIIILFILFFVLQFLMPVILGASRFLTGL